MLNNYFKNMKIYRKKNQKYVKKSFINDNIFYKTALFTPFEIRYTLLVLKLKVGNPSSDPHHINFYSLLPQNKQ